MNTSSSSSAGCGCSGPTDSSPTSTPQQALIVSSVEFPPQPVTTPGAEGATIRELLTHREGTPTFAMRLFELEPGGRTPYHTHVWEHEVFILEGEGRLEGPPSSRPLHPGDAVFVPPNVPHQFINSSPKRLRFLCLIPNPKS